MHNVTCSVVSTLNNNLLGIVNGYCIKHLAYDRVNHTTRVHRPYASDQFIAIQISITNINLYWVFCVHQIKMHCISHTASLSKPVRTSRPNDTVVISDHVAVAQCAGRLPHSWLAKYPPGVRATGQFPACARTRCLITMISPEGTIYQCRWCSLAYSSICSTGLLYTRPSRGCSSAHRCAIQRPEGAACWSNRWRRQVNKDLTTFIRRSLPVFAVGTGAELGTSCRNVVDVLQEAGVPVRALVRDTAAAVSCVSLLPRNIQCSVYHASG